MANPCSNFKNTYYDIYTINTYFGESYNGQLTVNSKCPNLIHKYCHYENDSGNGNCHNDYLKMASSGVIHLLKHLKDKYNLEYDKLAEYAILWLSYKLNIYSKNTVKNLNDFYDKYIETNKDYYKKIKDDDTTTYKDIIDKKKDLMNININEISKSTGPFHILFYLYYVFYDEYWDYNNRLNNAKSFANQFEKLNNDPKNIKGSLYTQILSTLSDDYKKLKNIYYNKNQSYNFPPLPELTPKENPVVNTVDSPGKGAEKILEQTSEATSSSSSILNTVIPGLSTFAIPVFLGVAYKYSLFGIDKLFQRPFIRKKLKNIKKKMKLNI
ncbi:PIR protein CIR protein [Plasmodium vinckei vinckei]|uniref:PIR protein CIR protein n=1 Tax=Plasmodium vinckei vinckei TaxID=54757 RepID=A0A081IAN5_PLAVN|nr:PIR protein CIR protein [Plasmodium vinckei vinckei]KEG00743.1 hypothetical protein YYE_04574 [Plasmodium vinckei vinckei]VEV54563.1 PIR protein CIR protein [Plasmodium vinckei vinckei]